MGVVGISLFGIPEIHTDKIVWQGSDEPEFVCPRPVDYVAVFDGVLVFIGKPTHMYIRFCSSNDNARVTVNTGSHLYLGYALGGDEVLSLEGFDWKRYQKRLTSCVTHFSNTGHERTRT